MERNYIALVLELGIRDCTNYSAGEVADVLELGHVMDMKES